MRIGELARRAGVTVKAVRYYERLGLLRAPRSPNGYRDYDDGHLRAAMEIRELADLGMPVRATAPFIECLDLGHEHGDDCVVSLASYRDSIAEIDRLLVVLQERRARLVERLMDGASRALPDAVATPEADHSILPPDLPVPDDDGAAEHLPGMRMPALALRTTGGGVVDLSALGSGRTILYLYPLTGHPHQDLPAGWDSIPGARGCTAEACDFRDHHAELRAAGADRVWGLSSQETTYQAELTTRLRLPFEMISDPALALADSLRLPTFSADGQPRLYSRLTMIIRDGRIEHVFYPIFPPNTHAQQVLAWLEAHPL